MTAQLPTIEEAEVVVVGAGPAGSTCAAKLAEQGRDVLLVDQDEFPRDKPCGDGVTRSAIEVLEELGLSDLVESSQPIEGVRAVFGFSLDYFKPVPDDDGRPRYARCIPRKSFDRALVAAASERGARFLRARASGLTEPNGDPRRVVIERDGKSGQIAARQIVAADGVTSRLRSSVGFEAPGSGLVSYAVRQYFTTEKPLDPVYQLFVPVHFEGRVIAGYGWIFPNGSHEANIGIGFMRGAGLGATPSLRAILESFVSDLQQRRGEELGRIESQGKPHGSPLAIGFSPDRCQIDNVTFVGDAARMTDPWSGEGIAKSMNGAKLAAEAVEASLSGRDRAVPVGRALARRYPRLGQDPALSVRFGLRAANAGMNILEGNSQPFLEATFRLIKTRELEASVKPTAVWPAMAGQTYDCRRELERLNYSLLEALECDFPFTTELLHREVRAGGGPLYAAALLLTAQACGGQPSLDARKAAAAVELLPLGPGAASEIVDRPSSEMGTVNNTLCVLTADFAFSRAYRLASEVSAETTGAMAATTRRICEGEMLEIEDVGDTGRTRERYYAAIERQSGAPFALAAQLGAKLGGRRDIAYTLRSYGRAIGLALRIRGDVLALTRGDAITDRKPGADLVRGNYSLPVIYSAQADPALAGLLDQARGGDPAPALASIEAGDGIARAIEDCRSHIATARAVLAELPDVDETPLQRLADLALEGLAADAAQLEPEMDLAIAGGGS